MAEEVAGSSPDEQVSVFQALQADDPAHLGDYALAARLGAGGMGKVYLSHTLAGRPVAIKAIRPELADDPNFRRRFRQEVAAARRVHGLYTAPVIDSEIDTPPLWLATAFVQGPALSAAVSRHGTLPVPSVLLLAAGVAEALQAVHGEGIVHRDLKASNVLLASDGPRVIDFGIARAVDATTLTSTGIAVGTPPFMSPEQALNKDVGPATDIFSLGQLVTYAAKGTPAFGEGQSYGVLFRIVYEEPDLTGVPEALLPLLKSCLAKDPTERPSPAEVISLCRAASEDGMLRRTGNWLPQTVTTDITWHQDVPQQHLTGAQMGDVSEIAADKAQLHTRTASPGSATSPGPQGATDSATGARTGARVEPEAEPEAGADHARDTNTGSGGPTSPPPPAPPPDHADTDGAIPWATEPPPPAPHRSAPPTPPEKGKPEPLSSTHHDAVGTRTSGGPTSNGKPEIARESPAPAAVGGGRPPSANTPRPDPKPIRRRALLALGVTALAGAGGTTAVISQRENGYAVKSAKRLTGHKSYVSRVAFSPDSKTLATEGAIIDAQSVVVGSKTSLWDVETCKHMKIPTNHNGNVTTVVFSPDGKTLATASGDDENVFLWNTETHQQTKIPTSHKDGLSSVVFSPDSKTLATANWGDGNVSLWDIETGERTRIPTGHKEVPFAVFSLDSKTLATANYEDENVFLWDTETGERTEKLTGLKVGADEVVLSPDGRTLATAYDENIYLWDMETLERIKIPTSHEFGIEGIVFSPDSKTLATAGWGGDENVFLWDNETGEFTKELTGHKGGASAVVFSPDGRTLATGGRDGAIRLWKASGNDPISAARIKKQS